MKTLLVPLLLAACLASAQNTLEIIGAYYGAGDRFIDVAARLRTIASQSRGSGFQLTVQPASLGGVDPAVASNSPSARGAAKVLRVYYRVNGEFQYGEWREGETAAIGPVRVPAAAATSQAPAPGELRIVRAVYGDGRRSADVANVLHRRIRDGRTLEVAVTNENLGGDPAPAVAKSLVVTYQLDGQTREVRVPENGILRIPEGGAGLSKGLQILSAIWGAGNKTADVTSILAGLVTDDRLTLTVGTNTLALDPARGEEKTLRLVYAYDWQQYDLTVNEGKVLDIPVKNMRTSAPSLFGGATDGVCFYAETNFQGGSYCLGLGQTGAQQMSGAVRVGSVRLRGKVRQVELFEQPGYKGRSVRLQENQPDLNRFTGGGNAWVYRPGSVRMN